VKLMNAAIGSVIEKAQAEVLIAGLLYYYRTSCTI
jgi:hypothetical protein